MRYKVKLEQEFDPLTSDTEFKASLYEDPPNGKLRYVAVAFASTKEEALLAIRRKRDAFEARREPEWFSLEDVPEPTSLKVV